MARAAGLAYVLCTHAHINAMSHSACHTLLAPTPQAPLPLNPRACLCSSSSQHTFHTSCTSPHSLSPLSHSSTLPSLHNTTQHTQPLHLGCKPDQGEASVVLGLSCMAESAFSTCAPVSVRGLSWSPAGCSASGSCVLAVVTSDGKVRAERGSGGIGGWGKGDNSWLAVVSVEDRV